MLNLQNGTTAPEYVEQGIGYDAGRIAVDLVGAIDHYSMGLPFTEEGRLCVENALPVRVNASYPYTATGRLAVAPAGDVFTWFPLADSLDSVNGIPTTLTRASIAIYPNATGDWLPHGTDAELLAYGVQNKCTNYNLKPDAALLNVTDNANITTTRVLISDVPQPYRGQIQAQMKNLTDRGVNNGYIFKSTAGPTGTPSVSIGGTVGNLNDHIGSVLAVVTGETGISSVLRVVNQTSELVEIPSTFNRVNTPAFTPTSTARALQLRIRVNETCYWLGIQLEESTTVSSSIQVKEDATVTDRIFLQNGSYTSLTLQNYGVPAYGVGLYIDPDIENKCTNFNLNPDAGLTNVVDAADVATSRVLISSLSEPLKSRVLANFGALIDSGVMNGYIFKSTRTGGTGFANVTITGTTGSTGQFSLSMFAESELGTSIFRLSAQFPDVAIPTVFTRAKSEDVASGATTRQFQIRVDDGDTVYWLGNQLEESTTVSSSIVECAGGIGTQALTDAQVPCFSDNYSFDSQNLLGSKWQALGTDATIDGANTCTFGGTDINDRVRETLTTSCVAGGTYTAFYLLSVDSGTKDARLVGVDNVGSSTVAITITEVPTWFSVTRTFDAGSTARYFQLSNSSPATAGTVNFHKYQVTTSPILPKYLLTTGSPKIYEMGNMIPYSEEIGGTGWTAGNSATVTDAGAYGIAPDGRQTTSLIEDANASGNAYWLEEVTVADDTETRVFAVDIRKTTGTPTHYPSLSCRYTGGAPQVTAKSTLINTTTGEITYSSADSAEVQSNGDFWRVLVTLANNGSGNTTAGIIVYPAANTDGSSAFTGSTVGTQEVWGAQIIDYDVDTTQYCPTWGTARKLKYNQIWENRVWMYGELPQGIFDNGASQAVLEVFEDINNFFRIVYSTTSVKLLIQLKLGGVFIINQGAAYVADGTPLSYVLSQSDIDGVKLELSNGAVYTDGAETTDYPEGSTVFLGRSDASSSPLSAQLANLKWGVLPAGGITYEEAKNKEGNASYVSNGLPFTDTSQLAVNMID
jgi:hypothetical protein